MLFTEFEVHGSVHRKYMYVCMYVYSNIYPTRCNVTRFIYILGTALHVSGGISTRHQERVQLYLQHLVFVRPLLLPAAIAAGSSNGLQE